MSEKDLYEQFNILNESLIGSDNNTKILFLSKISFDINHMKNDKELISKLHDDLVKIIASPETDTIKLNYDVKTLDDKYKNLLLTSSLLEKENVGLKSQILLKETERGKLIQENALLVSENERLVLDKKKYLKTEETNIILQGEKGKLEASNLSLLSEKGKLEASNLSLLAEKKRLESSNASLLAEKGKFEIDLSSTRAEILRLTTENNKIALLNAEISSLRTKNSALETQVLSLAKEIAKLHSIQSVTSDTNRWKGLNTDMIFYNSRGSIKGGESDNIWPVVSMKWAQFKPNLGIVAINNENIKFKFVPNGRSDQTSPILGKGSFTAIYQMVNDYDNLDDTKYILRIYERANDSGTQKLFHLLNEKKIEKEHELFPEYYIKIFYYGQLKTYEKDFTKIIDNDETIGYTKKRETYQYSFDYILTKVYGIPSIDDRINRVKDLSNDKKYKFLINNIKFLDKLQKNNMIHADYKIENIGWEGDEMKVVMIDYDLDTLQLVDLDNKNIIKRKINRSGAEDIDNYIMTEVNFISTYWPKYLFRTITRPKFRTELRTNKKVSELIKYSTAGLKQLIEVLDLQYTANFINNLPLPATELEIVTKRNISELSPTTIADNLNLDDISYDNIPRYEEILNVFEWLNRNGHIA